MPIRADEFPTIPVPKLRFPTGAIADAQLPWPAITRCNLPNSTKREYSAACGDDGTWQKILDVLRSRIRRRKAERRLPVPPVSKRNR